MLENIFQKKKEKERILNAIFENLYDEPDMKRYVDNVTEILEKHKSDEDRAKNLEAYIWRLVDENDFYHNSSDFVFYIGEKIAEYFNNIKGIPIFGIPCGELKYIRDSKKVYAVLAPKIYKNYVEALEKEIHNLNDENLEKIKRKIDKIYYDLWYRSSTIPGDVGEKLGNIANKVYEFEVGCVKREAEKDSNLFLEIIKKYVRKPGTGIYHKPPM